MRAIALPEAPEYGPPDLDGERELNPHDPFVFHFLDVRRGYGPGRIYLRLTFAVPALHPSPAGVRTLPGVACVNLPSSTTATPFTNT